MFNVPQIKYKGLCIGCGLCESFAATKMEIAPDGFLYPDVNNPIEGESGDILKSVCPAINIDCVPSKESLFGHISSAYEGWSRDNEIRYKASSGGIITSICCFLLENNMVDGIIQVRKSPNEYMLNEMHISRNIKEVIESSSSRYAPVSMFNNIKSILNNTSETYAFVGKPCDIMTLTKLIDQNESWKSRIKYKFSLVCAGIPSYNATEELIEKGRQGRQNLKPVAVRYRGEGWPGNFKVDYSDKTSFIVNYDDSWGKVLGRTLNIRCKICPDGIGNYADIVVGDYWNTKNGYPEFSEKDGKCFILVRTTNGQELIDDSIRKNYIEVSDLNVTNLESVQPYQYEKLKYAGYKLLVAKIFLRNIIRVKNMRVDLSTPIRGLRILLGTIKRMNKAYGHKA